MPLSSATTSKERYIGKRIPRVDGRDKVTGKALYPTDLYFPGMLWGRALLSRHVHARIHRIDVERARCLPGVEAVLTAQDIPGENGFGYLKPNWPVICSDRVRYRGDVVALVAAVDDETAAQALSLIEVEYQPLPVVDSPGKAIQTSIPPVHDSGNIMYYNELANGDTLTGFKEADLILEENYFTPRQEHAYLEVEGGVGMYDNKNESFTIWCGGQYVFGDRYQIARVMAWDPEKIRVISSPTGGAFGGKTSITVQIQLALLAYYTNKPVRLHRSREESMLINVKRHPMEVNIRIGAKNNGTLTAFDTTITADGGPYDDLSIPVFNIALQAAPGPYRYDNAHFKGRIIYTNNSVSGAFRGFGTIQPVFGIEQEMDKLAERMKMDPLELRLINALKPGDHSPLGNPLMDNAAMIECLSAARNTDLWQNRRKIKERLNRKSHYRKHGVGVAAAWMVIGLGPGRPDVCNVSIEVEKGGSIILRTGAIEIGQGNLTAYSQILAEAMECDIKRIKLIRGDTALTPDSGTVTASRSVLMIGNAILNAAEKLKSQLVKTASKLLAVSEEDLEYINCRIFSRTHPNHAITVTEIADLVIHDASSLQVMGSSLMKANERSFGAGIPGYYFIYFTNIALVAVDPGTGQVEVLRLITVPEVGRAINPAGVEGQCEGGGAQGVGFALHENYIMEKGELKTRNLSTYLIPTASDVPEIQTFIVEVPEKTGPFGAKGVGEGPICAVAPAIANAIHDAVGVRFNEAPITPEKVWEALSQSKL